jgi:aldehyde:ferredoxin oxidoreductase
MSFSKNNVLNISDFLIKAAGVSKEALGALIDEAKTYNYSEVLIPPFLVRQAAEKLRGSGIKIVSIIDFPYGLSPAEEKALLARSAAAAGASVVEITPNALIIKEGDLRTFEAEFALISSQVSKIKDASTRVAVNELILSSGERANLCHCLDQKKIPYRVISLNTIGSSPALYSFNEDLDRKIISVDLNRRCVKFQTIDEIFEKIDEKERSFLFGRALVSAILRRHDSRPSLRRGEPACEKLIAAPAALASSGLSSSDIISLGAFSPANGRLKIISRPARAASALARLGVLALIIEGAAPGYNYLLKISEGRVQIISGEKYCGANIYDAAAQISSAHGNGCSYLIQSPMAAFDSPVSTVSADDAYGLPDIQFGGGLGMVMKNLGLTAVLIDAGERQGFREKIAGDKKSEYDRCLEIFAGAAAENQTIKEQISPYGTASMIAPLYEAGALPMAFYTKFDSRQGVAKISGAALKDAVTKRKGSTGVSCSQNCVIKCKNIYPDDKKRRCAYIEYEHLAGFASMNEIYDIELTAKILRFCREKGLDFIELSYSIGELIRSGFLKGPPAAAAAACLTEIENRTLTGSILIKGAFAAATAFGRGAPMTMGGEAMPPYDPRAIMSLGVSYLSSPIGAEEKSAGFTVPVSVQKAGGYIAGNKTEGQLELSRNMQVAYYLMDTVGICHNAVYPLLENSDLWNLLVKLISLRYNIKLSVQDITRFAKKMIKEEHQFNNAAPGRIITDLPALFYETFNPVSKSVFGFGEDSIDKIFDAWQ